MDGTKEDAPHHQLLHLVEAAQLAGYSEREIVQLVEAELETGDELDQAA
jgi:thymidine phosphorylase